MLNVQKHLRATGKRLVRLMRGVSASPIQGTVDGLFDGVVTGWAFSRMEPERPLRLVLEVDSHPVAEGIADLAREDLRAAGIGTGKCGYRIPLPPSVLGQRVNSLRVRVAATGQVIGEISGILNQPSMATTTTTAAPVAKPATPQPGKATNPSQVLGGHLTLQWQESPKSKPIAIHARILVDDAPPRILGKIERQSSTAIGGWAFDTQRPRHPVSLDLYIDGVLFRSIETSIHRPDVRRLHRCHPNAGFFFELPANLDIDTPASVDIRSPVGTIDWGVRIEPLRPTPNAKRAAPAIQRKDIFDVVRKQELTKTHKIETIALIVLNRNGAKLLDEMLRTYEQHAVASNIEILIVDHGSDDNSEQVVTSYFDRLPIRWLPRKQNYSFSASNNWGARQTSADLLIFANNDIEFCSDVVQDIGHIMQDDSIGMLGVQLFDKLVGSRAITASLSQHLGVFFRSVFRDRLVSAFESRAAAQFDRVLSCVVEVPAVTGAFMAMRRPDFLAIGGFDEAYFYGYEDVDLSLRIHATLKKKVAIANHLHVIHHRGFTRTDPELSVVESYASNWRVMNDKFGYWLRHAMLRSLLTRPGYWTSLPPKIAFAVTDARDSAAAGDYFTALELGREIQNQLACKVIFLDKNKDWFDLEGIDIVVVMRDDYDLSRIRRPAPHLVKIAWARNWIDRWAERPWAEDYSQFWASSQQSAEYLRLKLARPVPVLAIGTNFNDFSSGSFDESLASDYCFTGSYWGVERDIVDLLDPAALPNFRFVLFGYGWEKHPRFSTFTRGGLPYSRMRDVYASTRIVIDDANSATRRWGSVNSRVFDALAAGALVVTNGEHGVKEVFHGLIPTYSNRVELETILNRYLTNESERVHLVTQLQSLVREHHTYAHRASTALDLLRTLTQQQFRISIKIGAPTYSVREEWGDWHFAIALRRAFSKLGHTCRIDCLDRWNTPEGLGDQIVIVLRGLSQYEPKRHQINLMWNISHPDKIDDNEYEQYDHIFVASHPHARVLRHRLQVPVDVLLQCTDPERFNLDTPEISSSRHDVLFVGNSRKVLRRIVKDAIEAHLPVTVYGMRWEGLIPTEHIAGEHIANFQLASYYRSAGVLLNDHWDTMRDAGFLSNRLFDAVASGARVVSDPVEGIEEVFGDFVVTYRTLDELQAAVHALRHEGELRSQQRRDFARSIGALHSFDTRAAEIMRVIVLNHAARLQNARAPIEFAPDGEAATETAVEITA